MEDRFFDYMVAHEYGFRKIVTVGLIMGALAFTYIGNPVATEFGFLAGVMLVLVFQQWRRKSGRASK